MQRGGCEEAQTQRGREGGREREAAAGQRVRDGAHLEQAEIPSLELASQAVGALAGLREHLSDGALSSHVSPSF